MREQKTLDGKKVKADSIYVNGKRKKAAKNLEWIEANVSSNYPGLNFDFFVYICFIAVHRCRFVVGFSEDGMGIRKCKKRSQAVGELGAKKRREDVWESKKSVKQNKRGTFLYYFSLFFAAHIELRAELSFADVAVFFYILQLDVDVGKFLSQENLKYISKHNFESLNR